MNKRSTVNSSAAILALFLSVAGGGWANAAMPPTERIDTPASERIFLSQALRGQCRAAKRNIFIYSARSTDSQKLQALSANDRVRLADNAVDGNGWMAIDQPRPGFVRAQDLLPSCDTPVTTGLTGQCRAAKRGIFIYSARSADSQKLQALSARDRVRLSEPSGQNGWIGIDRPIRGFVRTQDLLSSCETPVAALPPSRSNPNLCRRVLYDGVEGMTIRSGPGLNFPRVGGVFLDDRVFIDPSARRLDGERREWVKLTSPVSGWMSNGFPDFGERNLATCP